LFQPSFNCSNNTGAPEVIVHIDRGGVASHRDRGRLAEGAREDHLSARTMVGELIEIVVAGPRDVPVDLLAGAVAPRRRDRRTDAARRW
jgi:hypothetical protein